MTCHEVCQFKHDAYMYKKAYETLKDKVELGKLDQALEREKQARLNAMNEKDRLQKRLEEQTRILDKYKEDLSFCKKQSVWKKEEFEDQLKEERQNSALIIKKLKSQIDCLQKEIQDQKWRNEKQQKEMESRHKKEIKEYYPNAQIRSYFLTKKIW